MYGGLFTQAELDREKEDGFVRINAHPEADLWILNYTEKAAYEGHWNNVTLNCRGLIVDIYGDIVARPFPKFFNYGQVGCPEIDLDEPALVSDKMDGSLGIFYPDYSTGEYAIATRGSFTSDQAIHATEILRTKYADFKPMSNITYLFEIIYPENRIVCDYAGMDDLVLIGAVDINTGSSCSPVSGMFRWSGPVTEIFSYGTMREALVAEPRVGKEGFVVHFLESDVRVKIKQEDYCKLHAALSNLSSYSIWTNLSEGKSVEQILEILPDETHSWVKEIATVIMLAKNNYINSVVSNFNEIGKKETRKDFALIALNLSNKAALFNLYDDKPIEELAWKNVKPVLITLGESKDKLYGVPSNK